MNNENNSFLEGIFKAIESHPYTAVFVFIAVWAWLEASNKKKRNWK